METHRLLWAKSKPIHLLWRHTLDVAAVAEALWPRFGKLEDMPCAWAAYLCALHDVGKADPWFQNKDEPLAAGLNAIGFDLPPRLDESPQAQRKFRHEARSSGWIDAHLKGRHGWGRAAGVVVTAIRGHHGDFSASAYSERQLES